MFGAIGMYLFWGMIIAPLVLLARTCARGSAVPTLARSPNTGAIEAHIAQERSAKAWIGKHG